MEDEIVLFFRTFACDVLRAEGVDADSPAAVKQALLNHYEDIYPAFSKTAVFARHFEKQGHDEMVTHYKRCFTMLLNGRLP